MKRVGSVRGGFNHGRPLLQGANLSGLVALRRGIGNCVVTIDVVRMTSPR
jgi:hypothetical protein